MPLLKPISLLIFTSTLLIACAQNGGGLNAVGANGLLTPDAIFARYVNAVGGENVIRSHTSTTTKGRFVLAAMGLEGEANIFAAAPNRVSQVITLGGLGTIETGYNGEVAWSMDPLQGNSVLDGDALADLELRSDYYLPLNMGSLYEEYETQEITNINANEAYKVRSVDSRGKETFAYFSTDTGLLVALEMVSASPMGDIPTSTYMEEYREFEGYLQPTRLIIEQAGQEFAIEIDSITFDDVNESQFTPPAAIQSLLR